MEKAKGEKQNENCINRNIVECKYGPVSGKRRSHSVLIETLWNVNEYSESVSSLDCRINRNIVECKCESSGNAFKRVSVLIETLWNVNFISQKDRPQPAPVLIETLWNVN